MLWSDYVVQSSVIYRVSCRALGPYSTEDTTRGGDNCFFFLKIEA